MSTKGQMTGMLGTYLAAAELTRRDMIVSITSRNARGADLLATDLAHKRSWSIQVKTNRKAASFWLLSQHHVTTHAPTHVYVFFNLRGEERPDNYGVPSEVVAKFGTTAPTRSTGSVWHEFNRKNAEPYEDGWSIFSLLRQMESEPA